MGNGFRSGWVALVVFACGGSVGGGGERCPLTNPGEAQGPVPCATDGLVCTYGDQPTTCGRTFAMCKGGRFDVAVQTVCGGTTPCPPQPPVNGSSCTVDCGGTGADCISRSCAYPRGVLCACSTSLPLKWECTEPNTDTRCPDFMPNLGAPCPAEGASCDYNHCEDGMAVICTGGVWIYDGGIPCVL